MCLKNTHVTISKGKNTLASQSIWVPDLKNWLTDRTKFALFLFLLPERPNAEMYHITVTMDHFNCGAQQLCGTVMIAL